MTAPLIPPGAPHPAAGSGVRPAAGAATVEPQQAPPAPVAAAPKLTACTPRAVTPGSAPSPALPGTHTTAGTSDLNLAPAGSNPLLVITVYGIPGPQGSKAYKGHRNRRTAAGAVIRVPNLVESSAKVMPWRDAVEQAAAQAARRSGHRLQQSHDGKWRIREHLFTGPVLAEYCFTLPRPQRPKNRGHHITYPDLSKLIRSTEDALTLARVWADDALVTDMHRPRKRYVGSDDPDALDAPGAVIRIWAVAP